MPDVELYWNLGDWPLEHKTKNPLPMISWCGSQSTSDIILPTYDLTGSVLNMMGRVSLDIFSVQANDAPKWENKVFIKVFKYFLCLRLIQQCYLKILELLHH